MVACRGSLELLEKDVAGISGGDVVMLVEGGIGREEVAFFDIGHMLDAFDKDAVFLDAFNAFFDSAVKFGIEATGQIVAANVLGRQKTSIVVNGLGT